MKRHLLCTFLLATIGNLGLLSAQTVTESWAVLPPNSYPEAMAMDHAGNIYVANNNSTVSKITPDGTVTAAWAVLSSNAYPSGIVIDESGNVYTANYGDGTVSKITAGGVVIEAWATLANGTSPNDITIDGSGNI